MRKSIHQVKRTVKQPEYLKILTLRTLGNLLIISSLFMIAKTFYLTVKEEVRYLIESYFQKKYVVVDSLRMEPKDSKIAPGGLAQLLNVKAQETLVPTDPNFSIVVPKIGANSRIFANVNASDENEYLKVLKQGVAHASGTAFPGEKGHIFMFAHSTDYFWNLGTYNAVFYLLYKLEKGDEINIFYKGKRNIYRVLDKQIVDPSRVEFLTRKTNKEFLTLQTCWPPGTTLQRMLIFATRVAE